MAAVAESASTYGHYVLLQPEEHRDDNCEDDDDFVGNLFTMGQIICVVLTLCLGFVHIILPFINYPRMQILRSRSGLPASEGAGRSPQASDLALLQPHHPRRQRPQRGASLQAEQRRDRVLRRREHRGPEHSLGSSWSLLRRQAIHGRLGRVLVEEGRRPVAGAA